MWSRNVLKQMFSIQPNRAKRFFTLTLNLNKEIPLSCNKFNKAETILESHEKVLKKGEKEGAILLAVRSLETNKFVYFFQSQNEIEPFNFYKQVKHIFIGKNPLTLHNLVENFKLEEIEMKNRVRNKELAPNYLRE